MQLPVGITEERFLLAVDRVTVALWKKVRFGYHDADDLKQYICIFAIEVLNKGSYDPALPLENYLYTHCHRRMINLRRDQFCRNDPPCKLCHAGKPCTDGEKCQKYQGWQARNRAKKGLMNFDNLDWNREGELDSAPDVVDGVESNELFRLLDEKLPVKVRRHFLMLKAGLSVPKSEREAVIRECRRILLDDSASILS